MPTTPTYPGVYIQEIPSGVRSISGVGTSITAFIGLALRGPIDEPTLIHGYGDFERIFGGQWINSGMSYSVKHYFQNGGSDALIVRIIPSNAIKGKTDLDAGSSTKVTLVAANEGAWYKNIYATVDYNVNVSNTDPTYGKVFNLTIREYLTNPNTDANAVLVREEVIRNISVDATAARYIGTVLANESSLVRFDPASTATVKPLAVTNQAVVSGTPGSDGTIANATVTGTNYTTGKRGLYALDKADLFNMLVLPPLTRDSGGVWTDVANSLDATNGAIWSTLISYAKSRRAVVIVDPATTWTSVSAAQSGVAAMSLAQENAAIYFPQITVADPLRGNTLENFAPSGAVAGVIARTDAERGVWKAPAGLDARLVGVAKLSQSLTDGENGSLNPLGINVLRTLPAAGNVVWGARTMRGDDRLASDWKYLPVRRLALYIEESLYRGTQWVVFEPNDEPLWGQIRLNVGAFMHQLFRQGAFQGAKPSESYFVKCDKETTTQNDINQGVVNIIVGFAPLKPAEFVFIKLQQMAGQIVS